MKRATQLVIIIIFIWSCKTPIQQNETVEISTLESVKTEQKIKDILSQMTLKEKAGQMLNIGLPSVLTGGYWDARDSAVFDGERH